MFARVVKGQIKPGMMEEVIRIFQDSIVPAAKEQQGFRGIYFLTDRQANQVTSVSLWESEAALQATEASGYYQEQVAKIGAHLATTPVRELLEVSVQG